MNGILAWGNRGLSRFHAVRQVTENLNTSGKEGKTC